MKQSRACFFELPEVVVGEPGWAVANVYAAFAPTTALSTGPASVVGASLLVLVILAAPLLAAHTPGRPVLVVLVASVSVKSKLSMLY